MSATALMLIKATYYDTRDDSGKFAESAGGSGGGAAAKPTPTKAAQKKAALVASVRDAMADADAGLSPRGVDDLMAIASGDLNDPAAAAGLMDMGLAREVNGRVALTPEGKSMVAAMQRGDTDGALDAFAAGGAKAQAAKEKAQAKADKETETEQAAEGAAAAEAEKPKGGGGGGGGKPDPDAKKAQAAKDAAATVGLSEQSFAAMRSAAEGGTADPEASADLVTAGLMRSVDGALELTPDGQAALASLERGDPRGFVAARQRARDRQAKPATTKFLAFDADALAKADDEQMIVIGVASAPEIDEQGGVWAGERYDGDIVETAAIQETLDDFMQWANVREMHQPKAIGTVQKAWLDDAGRLLVEIKIDDADVWRKIKAGIYKGLSIGGRALAVALRRLADGRIARIISKLRLGEISVVDRPAHPAARILLAKRGDAMPPTPEDRSRDPLARLLAIAKAAAPDPTKATTMLQSIRDELELAGDIEGAALMTQAIGLVLQAAGTAEPPDAESEAEIETADAETEGEETGAPLDLAMGETDPDADAYELMAAARTTLRKGARLRMGKRMPGIEAIAKELLQLAADAGSAWASELLGGAHAPAPIDTKALVADVQKALASELGDGLQPVASALLRVYDLVAAQPAPGGPLLRGGGIGAGGVQKRFATEPPTPPKPPADDPAVAELRRLALVETHPVRKAQYAAQLAAITGGTV